MRLLLVEDSPGTSCLLARALRAEGYAVDCAKNDEVALDALAKSPYDIVLLDLDLPRRDGLSRISCMRRRKPTPLVLIITACIRVEDRIAALDAGADAYMTKPFDLDELLARVRALLRRSQRLPETLLQIGRVSLNSARHEVRFDDELVMLCAKEFAMLQKMLLRPGIALTNEQLRDAVHDRGQEIHSNTIAVYICGLRRKFGTDFIETVRGVGYRLPVSAPHVPAH